MKNLPRVSFSLLLCLFLNTFFLSCSKEYESSIVPIEEPVIQQVNGRVVNYITKEGIPNLDIELIWRSWFEGGVTDRDRTNENGEFTFYEGGYIEIKNHSSKYQLGAWVDGEYDSWFYVLGAHTNFNNDSPQELVIEVYPVTRIKINIRNVNPLSSEDKLELSVSNTSKGGHLSTDPVYTFQYSGTDINEVYEDRTIKENQVQIDYIVTRDGHMEELSKHIECAPGGLTEIDIEY